MIGAFRRDVIQIGYILMEPKADNCPSAQVLADFGLGILEAQSAETISQHLETCANCCDRVDSVPPDRFISLMREDRGRDLAAASSAFLTPAAVADSNDGTVISPELAASHDYEIVRSLGRGGMGVVYLARNRVLDRLEALKVVSKALLDRPGALERFQREMRSAARLNHPNIVTAHSAPRVGELLVLAMEYVDGQNLAQIVAESGPLPIEQAACCAYQAALGLQHAHERGMVHRDIKPGNLMLAGAGMGPMVKILDFGLAKATSETGSADGELTQSGQILGTPAYLAPEQSLDAARADIRADIYSLGCMLYFLLVGRPPFEAGSVYEVMHAHHHVQAPPLDRLRPDVPKPLAAVVAKMMAKDPAARYATPAEVARELGPFVDPQALVGPARARGRDALRRLLARAKRSPRKITLFSLGLLGIAVLSIVLIKSNGDQQTTAYRTVMVPSATVLTDPNAPPTALAPFDAVTAQARQAAWAKYLSVPVETVNSIGMKLVLIPPGEFTMGNTRDEIEAVAKILSTLQGGTNIEQSLEKTTAELPSHRVIISRPFLMGTTEVTMGHFRKFIDATEFKTEPERNRGGRRFDFEKQRWIPVDPKTTWRHPWFPTTDEFPVSVVSWNDAAQFCNWLSGQENLRPCYREDGPHHWRVALEGNGYRLPTEAQWEYACRAGTTSRFCFGDDPQFLGEYAWHWPLVMMTAQPVATKKANPFGLFDMHGNLDEWCLDLFAPGYSHAEPQIDPMGSGDASGLRSRRGGDWYSGWGFARSASRRASPATSNGFTLGFRVVRVAVKLDSRQTETEAK